MDTEKSLPEIGYIRLPEVLRIIPVGKTTWWDGVRSGRFPRGVKIGSRITAWRIDEIRNLVKDMGAR